MSPTDRILQIQREYFRLLKDHFHQERLGIREGVKDVTEAIADELTLDSDSRLVLPSPTGRLVSPFEYRLNALFQDVNDFWNRNGIYIYEAIRELGYQTVYGKLWSLDSEREIAKLSLYFDTICILDPLQYDFRVEQMVKGTPAHDMAITRKKTELFAKYLQFIKLEEAIVAQCEPPICIIYPSVVYWHYDLEERRPQQYALHMISRFLSELLGEDNLSLKEAVAKLREKSESELEHILKSSPAYRVLRPSRTPSRRIEDVVSLAAETTPVFKSSWTDQFGTPDGLFPLVHAFSSFYSYDSECSQLLLDPLLDPDQWELYLWKLEIEQREGQMSFFEGDKSGGAMVSVLNQDNLRWLGRVPLEDVVRLRQSGKLEEMRRLFRLSRKQLKQASLYDFEIVSKQVYQRLREEMEAHKAELLNIEREYRKRAAWGGARVVVASALAIASTFLPWMVPLKAAATTAAVVFGGKDAKDIVDTITEGSQKLTEAKDRPVALLVEAFESTDERR